MRRSSGINRRAALAGAVGLGLSVAAPRLSKGAGKVNLKLAMASQITNPVLKESLTDAAQRWAVLAAELETIHSLLDVIEEPEKKTG